MDFHLAAQNGSDIACEHPHDLRVAGLDNALREYLRVVEQVNVVLKQIKTKFLNCEAAVGNTADERVLQIAFPDLLRRFEQSFGGCVVQGGTPNEWFVFVS